MTLEERQKSIMMLEDRVSKLETVVGSPEGESDIGQAVMSLYGNVVQFQILLGDFFHDLAVTSSKLMEDIAQFIPPEIVDQLVQNQEDLADVVPLKPRGEKS